jgi:hypothetical protein
MKDSDFSCSQDACYELALALWYESSELVMKFFQDNSQIGMLKDLISVMWDYMKPCMMFKPVKAKHQMRVHPY